MRGSVGGQDEDFGRRHGFGCERAMLMLMLMLSWDSCWECKGYVAKKMHRYIAWTPTTPQGGLHTTGARASAHLPSRVLPISSARARRTTQVIVTATISSSLSPPKKPVSESRHGAVVPDLSSSHSLPCTQPERVRGSWSLTCIGQGRRTPKSQVMFYSRR